MEEGAKKVAGLVGDKAVFPGVGQVLITHVDAPIKAYQGDTVGVVGSVLQSYGSLSGATIGMACGGPPGAVIGGVVGFCAGCAGKEGYKKLEKKMKQWSNLKPNQIDSLLLVLDNFGNIKLIRWFLFIPIITNH